MAPKKRARTTAVTTSPRKTRSATAGKRLEPPTVASPAKRPSKKVKVDKEKKGSIKQKEDVKETALIDSSGKSIVIEACKQCNSFKTRANSVKEGLESAIAGITVTINPEKPRRGCFEIRDGSGELFISLLAMKRPFDPMKALDMNAVIKDIVQKIK